jgi:hypothetical protein
MLADQPDFDTSQQLHIYQTPTLDFGRKSEKPSVTKMTPMALSEVLGLKRKATVGFLC